MRIGADGSLSYASPGEALADHGSLAGTPESAERTLDGLLALLQEATKDPNLRLRDGSSKVVLSIEASGDAPVRPVDWVVQVAAHPKVKIRRVRFAAPGGGSFLDQMIPPDLSPNFPRPTPTMHVSLRRLDADDPARARTQIKVEGAEWSVPGSARAAERAAIFDAVQSKAAALLLENSALECDLNTPRHNGTSVPYADLFSLMQALRAAGFGDLWGGSPSEEVFENLETEANPHLTVEVSEGSFEALVAALNWLAAHQSEDGRWEAEGFGKWCDGAAATGPIPTGSGRAAYDVGVTALATLAFLSAGPPGGAYSFSKALDHALKWLRSQQDAEGLIGSRSGEHFLSCHAIAAEALVQAYRRTGGALAKGSAQKALDFVALARKANMAGSGGGKPAVGDKTVTSWMGMALVDARLVNEAARKAGAPPPFVIDEEALAGIKSWFDKPPDPSPMPLPAVAGAFPPEKAEAMTAISILLHALTGEDPASEPLRARAATLRGSAPPVWKEDDGSIDLYLWYYGSHAMFQLGGESWQAWETALRTALLGHQRTGERCAYGGSWDPVDHWGSDGGRVYSTAMAVLCLDATIRYPRAFPGK